MADEYDGPRGWSGGSDDGPWQVAQSDGPASDWATLSARLDEMLERRKIRKAMLGPDRKPPDPIRTWSPEEAAPFLPPGRELRRCESLERGYPGEACAWPAGPWDSEPDRFEWRAPGTTLPLLAVRNRMGAWCGYVGLPPDHWRYGADYDHVDRAVNVHGGLTFSGRCGGNICHEPAPGEPEEVWWIGFDCSHAGDLTPHLEAVTRAVGHVSHRQDTYRTLAYAVEEVESLAEQCETQQRLSLDRIERAHARARRHQSAMGRREKRRGHWTVAS